MRDTAVIDGVELSRAEAVKMKALSDRALAEMDKPEPVEFKPGDFVCYLSGFGVVYMVLTCVAKKALARGFGHPELDDTMAVVQIGSSSVGYLAYGGPAYINQPCRDYRLATPSEIAAACKR